MSYYVQAVPIMCEACKYSPVQPRIERTHDAFRKQTIVEAHWACPHCGNNCRRGIIEEVSDDLEQIQ